MWGGMSRYIIKLDEYYFEWSTIVASPVTYGMTLDEFKSYYRDEYGRAGMEKLPARLERVHEKGNSCLFNNISNDELIKYNHAGDNEECLTPQGIIAKYVRDADES